MISRTFDKARLRRIRLIASRCVKNRVAAAWLAEDATGIWDQTLLDLVQAPAVARFFNNPEVARTVTDANVDEEIGTRLAVLALGAVLLPKALKNTQTEWDKPCFASKTDLK